MKPGPFNKLIAEAYRVEEKTVVVFTRALKEADLITTGGRGVNAPDMTPLDAARVTIALLATDKPARAAEMVRRFGGLPYAPSESKGDHPAEFGIRDGITLEEVLANIFASDGLLGSAHPYVEIRTNARTASIEYVGGGIFFRTLNRSEELVAADHKDFFGIRRSSGVASAEMMQIWVQFYCERRDGPDWQSHFDAAQKAIC
jgi:hypothetical protein